MQGRWNACVASRMHALNSLSCQVTRDKLQTARAMLLLVAPDERPGESPAHCKNDGNVPKTSFSWKWDSRLFQSGCFASTRGLPSKTRPYLHQRKRPAKAFYWRRMGSSVVLNIDRLTAILTTTTITLRRPPPPYYCYSTTTTTTTTTATTAILLLLLRLLLLLLTTTPGRQGKVNLAKI